MGLFLDLTGVIGQSSKAVFNGLQNYLSTVDGDIEPAEIKSDDKNFCSIYEKDNNAIVFYPAYFLKTDECSAYLSKILNAPVFSLHIYDGDFWAYTLFVNGEEKDQFMPIPDYFGEDVSPEELEKLKGDAQFLAEHIPELKPIDVEKYLVSWDLDMDDVKAYEDDEFTYCDDQLYDFMRKLKLPYPMDDDGNSKGTVYRFWSKDIPLATPGVDTTNYNDTPNYSQLPKETSKPKPWWKFW